jgi:hypothetical protein
LKHSPVCNGGTVPGLPGLGEPLPCGSQVLCPPPPVPCTGPLCRRPRQPNPPPRDWCGSDGSEGVPDGNWGRACEAHDACYGRQGANKEQCDAQLALDIARECTANSMPFAFPACATIGLVYGGGLIVGGIGDLPARDAFDRAQRIP